MFKCVIESNFTKCGLIALIVALTAVLATAGEPVKVDLNIPTYTKTSGVSGNVNSVGSDTMNNLMSLWCEGFTKYYPNVKCQIEGKGSSTAAPALIEGTAQFGPMSRKMKSKEIDEFKKHSDINLQQFLHLSMH